MTILVTATVTSINVIEENKNIFTKEAEIEFTDDERNLLRTEKFTFKDTPEEIRFLKSLLVSNCKILLRSSNMEDSFDVGTRVDSQQ